MAFFVNCVEMLVKVLRKTIRTPTQSACYGRYGNITGLLEWPCCGLTKRHAYCFKMTSRSETWLKNFRERIVFKEALFRRLAITVRIL